MSPTGSPAWSDDPPQTFQQDLRIPRHFDAMQFRYSPYTNSTELESGTTPTKLIVE